MEEGKITVRREHRLSDRFLVHSDCITGNMDYVGVVWPERPTSVQAKLAKRLEWWARPPGGASTNIGPFTTRKAAAAALI